MIKRLGELFGRIRAQADRPCVPEDQRVYAVGDIHGRLDLFARMIEAIEADDAARERADTTVILLGDLVDRGPDSAGVIAAARDWGATRRVRMLVGNHEEMFLQALESEEALRHFLKIGGRETVLSYPIAREVYRRSTLAELRALLREVVPHEHIAFLQAMEEQIRVGDYVFVHAGIRPGIELEAQSPSDLRWIREPFLSHAEPHGFCVIHGHTIRSEVEVVGHPATPSRIGIDTGAFMSGRLTAIGLQGTDRWFMEAS